jgi:hypothetical protein
MNRFSSRWIDLTCYKTKDILLSVVGQRARGLQPSNKAKTFYKCFCPFHNERTPSMKFFYNRHFSGWGYKCFGCGKSGDVFTFLMKYEGWPFWDAMLHVTKHHTSGSYPSPIIEGSLQLKIPFPERAESIETDLPF